MVELYSKRGLTETKYARSKRVILRETKQRKMALARWCALKTMLLIRSLNDKSVC